MDKRTLSFLGLLRKGGNLVIGKGVEDAIPKCSLLIVAEDAGEAVKKALLDKAAFHHKIVLTNVSKETLGEALGFDSLSSVAIIHPKAAKKILQCEGLRP